MNYIAITQLNAIYQNKKRIQEEQDKIKKIEKQQDELYELANDYSLVDKGDYNHKKRAEAEANKAIGALEWNYSIILKSAWILRILFLVGSAVLGIIIPINSPNFELPKETGGGIFVGSICLSIIAMFFFVAIRFPFISQNKNRWYIILAWIPLFFYGPVCLLSIISEDLAEAEIVYIPFLAINILIAIFEFVFYQIKNFKQKKYRISSIELIQNAEREDQKARRAYERANNEYKEKRRQEYLPQIEAKDREIDHVKRNIIAIDQSCLEYMVHPYLREKDISYISALLRLLNEGRADSVKEAMNLQSEIDHRDRMHYQAVMNNVRQEKFQQDLAYEQKQANERFENEARRIRRAEEEKVEQLKELNRKFD